MGGIQYVTLSDDEAKRRGTQKSILERKGYPSFEMIIEINNQNSWTIHENVKNSVDLCLRGHSMISQVRNFHLTEKINIKSYNYSNFLGSMSNNLNDSFLFSNQNWVNLNRLTNLNFFKLQKQKL